MANTDGWTHVTYKHHPTKNTSNPVSNTVYPSNTVSRSVSESFDDKVIVHGKKGAIKNNKTKVVSTIAVARKNGDVGHVLHVEKEATDGNTSVVHFKREYAMRVQKVRISLGLKQAQLAFQLNIPHQDVTQLEAGTLVYQPRTKAVFDRFLEKYGA